MQISDKGKKYIMISLIIAAVVIVAIIWGRHIIAARPFYYAGTLETTNVIISSRVASDIDDVFVNEGDVITRDMVLMEMTCDAYKILATQINNDYDRAVALMSRGHVSQAELDIITRNKQDNDLKLAWCRVMSPIDGMVITRFREPGEIVAPGAPLIAVANPYDIWAYFYVPHDMLYKIRVGDNVTGILPEVPDKIFPGQIIKINEIAEFTPKNVQTRAERTRLVYGVKVKFNNPELILKSGMTIESTLDHE